MPIDVWFVMLPGVLSLDMTGPAETFVLAGDAFRLHYIGPQPEVPTSRGLTMSGSSRCRKACLRAACWSCRG